MYTLRFPFTLPLGQEIKLTEDLINFKNLHFSLKRHDNIYVLEIEGFSTQDEATSYISNVWAGLMWSLLHLGLSPNAELEPQEVVYSEDPFEAAINIRKSFGLQIKGSVHPVDGIIDINGPVVYQTGKHLLTASASGQVLLSQPASNVFRFLLEGVTFPKSPNIIEDDKLRVAVELYGNHFAVYSDNARFLTLVMSLEALAVGVPRPQLILTLLEKWKSEVDDLCNTMKLDSHETDAIKALRQELLVRTKDSIRQQIRKLVLTMLEAQGDEDAAEIAKNAVEMYDLRSTLVHEGRLELQKLRKATSDAKNIVERVLKIRFLQAAGTNEKRISK